MPETNQKRDPRIIAFDPKHEPSPVVYRPNDRYAIVGKTGSGKSHFTVTLATTLIAKVNETATIPWSCWIVDSKGDPTDINRLRQWGYVRVKKLGYDNDPDRPEIYRYFKLERTGEDENVAPQVAQIARAAYDRSRDSKNPRPTLLVVDEWTQAVYSSRRMGPRLLDIEQRGRGNRCGLIGETQEPVDVPRQLISQATHLFIFALTFERDIEYMQQYCPQYQPPTEDYPDSPFHKNPHAFYYRHIDGRSGWITFKHEKEWHSWLTENVKGPQAND